MSLSLCFFQQKNTKLADNEIEIPFKVKLYKFNFKSIKPIINRLQPEVKKRIKLVQNQVDKLLNSNQTSLQWMKAIQKVNIILILGLIVGIYFMTLEGTDRDLDSFQIGVYILAATGLVIIMLQILCIFLWHYSISYISHEVQLILLSETQRCGNVVQWRLHRGFSSIIFQYTSNALLSASQIMEGSQRSYLNNVSEEQFTKKPNNQSRFMKENLEKKKNQYAKKYDDEKERVKNVNYTTRGQDQEMASIGHLEEEDNEDSQLNNDESKSNKEVKIQQESKQKKPSKYNNEINLHSEEIEIEMTPQSQNNHKKATSHMSNKSTTKENVRQSSKQASEMKIKDEVLRFDTGEDELSQDILSEKHSQNQNILNQDQISNLNKTGQLSNQKQPIPLILELQNNNSQIGNQSSYRFQTDHNLLTTQILKKEFSSNALNDYTIDHSPGHLKPAISNDMNTPDDKQNTKKSNFKNYLHEGDEETPVEVEDDDNDHHHNDDSDSKGGDKQEINHQKKKSKFNQQEAEFNDSPMNGQWSKSPQLLKISPHDLDEVEAELDEDSSNKKQQQSQQSENQSQIESQQNHKQQQLLDHQ